MIIKLFGLPAVGKSTALDHLNTTYSVEHDDLITPQILALKQSNDYAILQLSILDNFRSNTRKHKNSICFQHTPLELIQWYSDFYFENNLYSSASYDYICKKITEAVQEENDIHKDEEIAYIYFLAKPKFLMQNAKQRSRAFEIFERNILHFLNTKLQTHLHTHCTNTSSLILQCKEGEYHTESIKLFLQGLQAAVKK